MNCPKCHAEMPEGSTFCSSCGQNLNAAPAYTAPTAKNNASQKAKTMSLVAKIVSVICAILFIVGATSALGSSITDLPIIKLIVPEKELAFDYDTDELEDILDDVLDEYEDELSNKEVKVLKNYVKDFQAVVNKPSVNNIKKALDSTEKLGNVASLDDSDIAEFEGMIEEINEIQGVLNTISTVVWVIAIVLILFALLAGFKLAFGWAIAAMIINILPSLLLVGVLHFVLVTVALIALIVVVSKAKAENKNYTNSIA